MILRLAVSVEHRLVTDRQTDTQRQLIPVLASIVQVKIGDTCEMIQSGDIVALEDS